MTSSRVIGGADGPSRRTSLGGGGGGGSASAGCTGDAAGSRAGTGAGGTFSFGRHTWLLVPLDKFLLHSGQVHRVPDSFPFRGLPRGQRAPVSASFGTAVSGPSSAGPEMLSGPEGSSSGCAATAGSICASSGAAAGLLAARASSYVTSAGPFGSLALSRSAFSISLSNFHYALGTTSEKSSAGSTVGW